MNDDTQKIEKITFNSEEITPLDPQLVKVDSCIAFLLSDKIEYGIVLEVKGEGAYLFYLCVALDQPNKIFDVPFFAALA